MWLMTNFGFFSIVQKKGDNALTVRARVRSDLEALKEKYVPTLGNIIEGKGTDYKYRAKVSREDLAEVIQKIVMDIDYSNFKDSVAKQQGYKRASIYGEVWSYLMSLQNNPDGFDPSERFILIENVPTMMIDVEWKDYGGWKPWQYKSNMDQLALIPGSKIRFNLLKGGAQKYCIEMNLDEWKEAMEQHMNTDYWKAHGNYWISFNRTEQGRFTENFKPNWVLYVKACPCERIGRCGLQNT